MILSMSAESALSFDMCAAAGATLVGFVRADGMKVYCDSGPVDLTDPSPDLPGAHRPATIFRPHERPHP